MFWFTGILGLLFAASPYVLGYSNNQAALWTSLLVGAGVAIVSALEALEQDKDQLEYWAVVILGAAAIVAPFALGFGNEATALWTSVIAGGLVAAGAIGRLVYTPQNSYG